MRILIITRSEWDDHNSVGNTMSVLWKGYDKNKLANLYFRASPPNNNTCYRYFSISEFDIVKNLVRLKWNNGKEFLISNNPDKTKKLTRTIKHEKALFGYFRKNTSDLLWFLQKLFWKLKMWKSKNLNSFLDSYLPEIIFSPCFMAEYAHDVLWYCASKANARVVLFHADDYLTENNSKSSLFARLNKKQLSKLVRKSALKADLNYCISPKQQQEYQAILNKEMKLLYKGADFSTYPERILDFESERKGIVYVGSTLYGRWQTLGMLAKTIKKVNSSKPFFELLIYSQYEPTEIAKKEMIIEGASRFMGKVPASQVPEILRNADIVLHVESFDKLEKVKTRLSFSTKIVDCLASGRCVMAIGWHDAASIDYLKQNDAALIANSQDDLTALFQNIKNNPALIDEYAQKAWECGKRNHQIDVIQANLRKDLESLIKK